MKSIYIIGGAVAVVAIATATYFLYVDQSADVTTRQTVDTENNSRLFPEAHVERAQKLKEKGYLIGDLPMGDADAAVEIIEYASLTCPHCRSFHKNILPEIKAQYIDTGKASLTVREVYFDQLGLYATALARCGGTAKSYNAFVDVFMNKQGVWNVGSSEAEIVRGVSQLKQLAALGGLSEDRADICLQDNTFLQHLFDTYQIWARADSVEATPTLIVAGTKLRGGTTVERLSDLLDEKLGE
jgi:protein-disulfide isomerase